MLHSLLLSLSDRIIWSRLGHRQRKQKPASFSMGLGLDIHVELYGAEIERRPVLMSEGSKQFYSVRILLRRGGNSNFPSMHIHFSRQLESPSRLARRQWSTPRRSWSSGRWRRKSASSRRESTRGRVKRSARTRSDDSNTGDGRGVPGAALKYKIVYLVYAARQPQTVQTKKP